MNILEAIIILLAQLAVAFATSAEESKVATSSPSSIYGLVLGDWGGMPVSPYYTPAQKKTADGMNTVAAALNGVQVVLALGDNFYFNGVQRSDSVRFEGTFESVYSGEALKDIPWKVIAGNHDHYGNVDAQVEYSKLNPRWGFPSLYHASQFKSEDKSVTVDVVMIDTVDLSGTVPLGDVGGPKVGGDVSMSLDDAKRYFASLPLREKTLATSQWDWIEQQLAASSADYLLVAGHYSVYSVCDHGGDETLLTYLKPLLEKYNAHYLSGHDHCMEHIQVTGSPVNYIVSGVGDTCCYKPTHASDVPEGSCRWSYTAEDLNDDIKQDKERDVVGGFASFEANATGLTFSFRDQDGIVLYTTPSVPPRKPLQNNVNKFFEPIV